MHILFLLLIFALVLPDANDSLLAQDADIPDRVQVRGANRSPEGLECDGNRFLLSSLDEGTVYAVSHDGSAAPFIEDADLAQSVGLEIDRATNRLLVVNADFEHPETAALGIYDLTTGERLHWVDLTALAPGYAHFPNDLAIAPSGVAYVTDSLAPVIYQVEPDGSASILLEDDRLLIDGFGGNGIVYHPDGYLLVGISGVELYRIPLDAPQEWTLVDTSVTVAADGMLWDAAGASLIAVSDGTILKLASADDWASADVTASARNHPASTVAFCGEQIYAIHPQRNAIVHVRFPG
jgi:sugar lactone lactonase YvrE